LKFVEYIFINNQYGSDAAKQAYIKNQNHLL